jgi:DNA invertase Pin-like site-specific DNA recombinase
VLDYLDGGRWQVVAEFTEIESGKRNDRPELERALVACKKQKAKLVIAKLDRLSRNLAFIATLMDSGVEFIAVDNPHANKLTVHILAAVAQHEREIISARTSAALKAAKARGKRLGNPRLSEARRHAAAATKERGDSYSANILPVIREIQRSGINSIRGCLVGLARVTAAIEALRPWHLPRPACCVPIQPKWRHCASLDTAARSSCELNISVCMKADRRGRRRN